MLLRTMLVIGLSHDQEYHSSYLKMGPEKGEDQDRDLQRHVGLYVDSRDESVNQKESNHDRSAAARHPCLLRTRTV